MGVGSLRGSTCEPRDDVIKFKSLRRIALGALIGFPFALLPVGEHVSFATLAEFAAEKVFATPRAKLASAQNVDLIMRGSEMARALKAGPFNGLDSQSMVAFAGATCSEAVPGSGCTPVKRFSASLARDGLALVPEQNGGALAGACFPFGDFGRRAVELT